MKTHRSMFTQWIVTGVVFILLNSSFSVFGQNDESRHLPTDLFWIKFTEQIVEMPDSRARVSPLAITNRAASVRLALLEIDPGMVLTRFRPEFVASDTLEVTETGKIIRRKDWSRVYRVQLAKEVDFYEIKEQLQTFEYIEWLSPPFRIHSLFIPNDLHGEGNQWNIPIVEGIHAWDITRGDPGIRIQIMDSGIAPHNDINNKVENPGEPFIEDPQGFSHGLSVAGVAGAETDNNLGIASLGFETSLVDASFANINQFQDFPNMVANYFEASWDPQNNNFDQLNADIINASFFITVCHNPPNCNQWRSENIPIVEDAVNAALDNDRIIVAAAGNPSPPDVVDDVPFELWPAAYDGVIAISASNSSDQFEDGYNYGNFVNLSAPAIDILLLDLNNQFRIEDGTSFASPLVAATAALMLGMNPGLTPTQITDILEATAEEVGQFTYTNGWNEFMGHGRLNAYEAVKAAMPQFTDHAFTSSTTLTEYMYLNGSTTLAGGATLTIPEGLGVVVDGSLSSTGSISTIVVEGNLVVEHNSSLNYIKLVVEEDGHLATRSGVTLDAGSEMWTINGSARIDGGFTMIDGNITVGQTGRLEFLGSADLFYDATIASPPLPPLYMIPYFTVRGEVAFSPVHTVQMNLSPNASISSWGGIRLFNTASGATLRRITVQDADVGVELSSASDITLQDIEIQSPADAGIISTSSGFFAEHIVVTGSSDYGVYIWGGTPDFHHMEVSGSSASGLFLGQFATSSSAEGNISGSGGGGSNAGVWIDNASHTQINGFIGPNSGWDVAAVNDAWGYFNGTSWSGGQPFTHVDGSSTLHIQNPNNPQSTGDGQKLAMNSHQTIRSQVELLQEWSERYRQDSGQAAAWLHQIQADLPDKLYDLAAILLLDHYLARGEFDAADLLADSADPGRMDAHLASGAFALRTLQLALHGPADEPLARQSLEQVRESGLEEFLVDRLAFMVEERYGMEDTGKDKRISSYSCLLNSEFHISRFTPNPPGFSAFPAVPPPGYRISDGGRNPSARAGGGS